LRPAPVGATRRAFRPLDGLCALLAAVVAQLAALAAGELLALTRHVRPRLVPSEEPPAAAVAARLVQLDAAALRELWQRLQERLSLASAEG
jgi:hypothetical protein